MPYYGTFKYAESEYGQSWSLNFFELVGPYRGHRFTMFMNEDGQTKIHDKLVDPNSVVYLRYLINGLILKFDLAMDHIMIFSPLIDDLQVGDNSLFFVAYQNTAEDYMQLLGADFLDGRKLNWDMGMIPFDTEPLHRHQESAADGDNWYLFGGADAVNDATHGKGATSGGFAVRLNAASEYTRTQNLALPEGIYRLFIRACDTNQVFEDLQWYVYDWTWVGWLNMAGAEYTTLTADWAWYSMDFRIPASQVGNNIGVQLLKTTGTANNIYIDEMVIFPISNSKNFPLDVRNQALGNIEIDESAE